MRALLMKHFKNIFFAFVFAAVFFALSGFAAAAPAPTPAFPKYLQDKIAAQYPHSNPAALLFNLQLGMGATNNVQGEASVWDTIKGFITGKGDDDKIQAVAAYIYNIYVTDAVYKKAVPPMKLDFNYIGVMDYLYRMAGQEYNYPQFYADNQEDIKKQLAQNFKQKLNIVYNTADASNTAMEKMFIHTLHRSKDSKRRYGYVAAQGIAGEQAESAELVAQLKRQLAVNKAKNNKLVSTYKEVDMMAVMDHAKTNTVQHYYRPVNEECAVCTYSFCRDICAALPAKYDQWRILKVYSVFAYPNNGQFVKTAQNADRFINPATQKIYPSWDYHAASLLVLNKGYHMAYIVVDPMLLAEPAPLAKWAQLFAGDTNYIIGPFRRSEGIEKQILEKSKLSSDYKPYPVRQ